MYQHTKGIAYALAGAGFYTSVMLINKLIKDLTGFEITAIQLVVAMLSYIDPISAIIISALVYGETMNIIQVFGGILILGATVPFQKD